MITAVVPSHNRRVALETTAPLLLSQPGIAEIVYVLDGCTDSSAEFLSSLGDSRVRVVEQVQSGQVAARKAGIALATGDLILFVDDDDAIAPNFVETATGLIERNEADIVGAPWLKSLPTESELSKMRASGVERLTLSSHPSTFPLSTAATPFMCSIALIRATVFNSVLPNTDYRRSAYREETEFYVSAIRAGFRVVMSPETFSYTVGDFSGGHDRRPFRYNASIVANNFRFLRRHGAWLKENDYLSSPTSFGIRFAGERFVLALREAARSWLRR